MCCVLQLVKTEESRGYAMVRIQHTLFFFFFFPALETTGSHTAAIVSQAFTKQLSQYTDTLK